MQLKLSGNMSRKFDTNKFINDVLNDKYALVVGNEIILNKDIEVSGDVHQFLLRKVNEIYGTKYIAYEDIALDKSERINPVRKLIENHKIQFCAEAVSKELIDLLNIRLFNIVLTTTTDGFLEAAMRKVWGNELRIVNIYDKDSVVDFQKAYKACRRGARYNQPTLIYVFGKMCENDLTKKYIRTDSDAILLIEKWMRMDVESSNELLDFIRGKRLLALGCKYDNWYFRFFWYVLTGNIDSEKFEGTGEVAFTLNTTEQSDSQLQCFLEQINICILGDATNFVRNLTNTLTMDSADAPFRRQIINTRRRGGIFVSYCNKDALAASQLFFQLSEKKYDVWIDNARIYGGNDYEKNIAEAINDAKIFIAVLSPQVASDLESMVTDNYYNKEWRIAQQFRDKTIIPVAINGYNLRSNYHTKFEEIIGMKVSGINLMDSDGFAKLVASINEQM